MEIKISKAQEGTPSEPFYPVSGVAKHFGLHEDTLRKWLKQHPEIPRLTTPAGIRLRISEMATWIKQLSTN